MLASVLDLCSIRSAGSEVCSAGSAAAVVRLLTRERRMMKEIDFIVLVEVGKLTRIIVEWLRVKSKKGK